jgi:hypothetical protein
MKARISIPGMAGGARQSLLGCAALMVLVTAAVSACTNSPSSSLPAIFSPSGTATHSGTAAASANAHATGSATATATGTPTKATTTPTPTSSGAVYPTTQAPTPTPTTYYPTTAPQTGGGGTAGLQNGLAIGLGGTAILAGLGSLGYRKRLTRRRR